VYLTDDYKGGGTLFPHLNLTVKPLKGRAVIWSGVKEDKEINPDGFHGGLPVQDGRKTVCNLWVRDQDQLNWQNRYEISIPN
jgi:prolyl 4-hydroxylase